MTNVKFPRRNAFSALAVVPVAVAAQKAMAATPVRNLDPVRDLQLILKKLHLRADDGVLFWWMVGTKIGQVGAVTTPLFGMEVGSIMRVSHKPDGGFDLTTLEIVFYTDLESGKWLREWKNPYTGTTVEVRHGPLGPQKVSYRADGSRVQVKREVGGAIIEGSTKAGPATIAAEDVWVRWDNTSKVTQVDGTGRSFLVNDWLMVHGREADILDESKPFIGANSQLHEITSWGRWQGMGDRDGNLTSRAIGAKVLTYEEMPAKWRALVGQADPKVAQDPIAALDAPAARLDR